MNPPLLEVENLHVAFATRHGRVDAVKDAGFRLEAGQTLGIVGESGSGKSVTAYAVTHLLERAGRIVGGSIRYNGRDITHASWKSLRGTHGASMSMIFQNPRAALNPIRTIGAQIEDALRAHASLTRAEARDKALALLTDVLIQDPALRYHAYPHELSGGMCQRVMIAVAIASAPALMIADEPTTGLDVTTQKIVMDLLMAIVRARGMALILITHDLGLAAQYCDSVAVMERGRVVDTAPPHILFTAARHPYTRRLVAASPTPTSRVEDLVVAPHVDPATLPADGAVRAAARETAGHADLQARASRAGTAPLLELQNVVKRYGLAQPAVRGVSFSIRPGESVGLVGESGSGKTTLSRMICRLLDPSEGDILFDGVSISDTPARAFHASPLRRAIQIVFQDPHDSLNPRYTAFDCIAHPLIRLERLTARDALHARVVECAARAGLDETLLGRYPHQLSGGQKARVGIARAIACRPRLLVLDEPTAALDVSVQAVILQLLDKLRREEGLTFLFVSHDLNVVRMMCERTIVLRHGEVVEEGESRALFAHPASSYTRELVAAIPVMPELAPERPPASTVDLAVQ
ncbi:MAG: ATP-binding cassette domain-containing protein [Janthinobacterium lividum]